MLLSTGFLKEAINVAYADSTIPSDKRVESIESDMHFEYWK